MAKPLAALLDAVSSRDGESKFYFVGDYVNRGPETKQVLDQLLALPAGAARFVRGNHDDIFGQVLDGTSYAPNASHGDRHVAFRWFLQYGLDSTLASYDANSLDQLIAKIPESHRNFIQSLEPVIEEPDLFVAHGYWPVDQPDSELAGQLQRDPATRHQLLWNRFKTEEIVSDKAWRRAGYFGHTPVELYPELLADPRRPLPIQSSKIRLLDTAVALQLRGRLTAYCHETSAFIQVNRDGRVVGGEE